jgi:hypothetical protein
MTQQIILDIRRGFGQYIQEEINEKSKSTVTNLYMQKQTQINAKAYHSYCL